MKVWPPKCRWNRTVILFIFMVMTSKKDCTAARILASVHQAKRGVPMFWSRLKHRWKFRVSSSTRLDMSVASLLGYAIMWYYYLIITKEKKPSYLCVIYSFKRVPLFLECTKLTTMRNVRMGEKQSYFFFYFRYILS